MKAHLKYLKYVLRHKWFVYVAGRHLGVSIWRLFKHDWHKFLPSEWNPYVAYFYGPTVALKDTEPDDYKYWSAREPVCAAFNHAWNLHQKRADHHWQFWLITMDSGETQCLQMSEQATREMVADWYGAGRAITGKWEAEEWYLKNRDKIKLFPKTREIVEYIFEERRDIRRRVQMIGISYPPF